MAFDQHWRWLITFTVPADDHQFKHNAVINVIDDEQFIRRDFKKLHNPDMKIIKCTRLTLDEDEDKKIVREADEANRKEGGADFRELRGTEMNLAQKQVDKIKAANEAME